MAQVKLCAISLFAAASFGADTTSAIETDPEINAIAAFQAKDQLLQNVGWKIAHGNAAFCDNVIPSIGLQLQDLASYGDPEVARAAFGLKGDFAVQTAARGSPSALSGYFRTNREISRLGAQDPNAWETEKRMAWQRLTRAHDFVDEALAKTGAISVRFADGETTTVQAKPACATRFELASRNSKAVAEGKRVVVGEKFVGFSYSEEIFAGAVAHELAHNLLGHRAWLDRNKRKRRHIRLTEREADRLMPWLMANAGYDPQSAVTFMETWGPKHDGGLFRSRTHDGWDERAEFIAAELPQIAELMKATGNADWSVHFRREIDPDQGLDQEQ
ncbi:MAG: hypothetical protein AAGL10_06215 [Pseudomonadota bacterium]